MELADYLPILMMVALGLGMVIAFALFSEILGPRDKSPNKLAPFECGHTSRGQPRMRFAVKYYPIAILFVLFDVEAVFLYPWAVVYGELKLFALVEMVIFLGILVLAFFYIWAKGGLEWD
ncbi:MAG: NADH-quinone oxidoreductase subunit A [bacterium]